MTWLSILVDNSMATFSVSLAGFSLTVRAVVKPPIIFGDISRSGPMTVEWTQYAQSLTEKPVKGMLTGPVTILNWSFCQG